MENIFNNVPGWGTWVFSGIGCVVLTWIVSLFFKKRNGDTKTSNKSTIKGDSNTAIQGSDNSTINIGK